MERPVNNIVQNISGGATVQQNVIIGDNNVALAGNNSRVDVDSFSKEIKDALKIVDDNAELNNAQKSELKAILVEADEGVREDSQEKRILSKSRFKTFCSIAGRSALTIINTLAGLATIASFFNLH